MNSETLSPDLQRFLRVLPFVDGDGGELNLWAPDWDGGQNALIVRGEEYADCALAIARQFQFPTLVALILRDMIMAGRWGAVEAGFTNRIASAANVGSYN